MLRPGRARPAEHRVLVTSFGETVRLATFAQLEGVVPSASSRGLAFALLGAKLGSAALVRRLLAVGVDGIVTNRADLAVDLLR